jgi:hypothetical protein
MNKLIEKHFMLTVNIFAIHNMRLFGKSRTQRRRSMRTLFYSYHNTRMTTFLKLEVLQNLGVESWQKFSKNILYNWLKEQVFSFGNKSHQVTVQFCTIHCTRTIDISQYRLLFGFSLLYTNCDPFELLDSAALLLRESWGGGGKIIFLNLTTIIYKWRRCRRYMTSQVEDL